MQVAAPVGCEAEARRFYGGVLGLEELDANDLDALAERIGEVTWADPAEIPGRRRFQCVDPFGNRLEFLE